MSMQDHIFETLRGFISEAVRESDGIEPETAKAIADTVTLKLQKNYGTQKIYIPAAPNRERDEKIKQEFNGRNHKEVCRNNGISERTLYRIIGG